MRVNAQSYNYGAARSAIREAAAYAAQRKAEIGASKVFDFSLGNPSVPAPDEIRQAIEQALSLPATELHGYTPAAGLVEARTRIAASLDRRFAAEMGSAPVARAEDLYLTCGAAASISICLHALVEPGDEVLVVAPYFPEYRVWIEAAGAHCIEVPAAAESFQLDVAALGAAITPRTKALILNSPNNPTGTIYPRHDLRELAAVLHEREAQLGSAPYVICDEPYRELSYGDEVPWMPSLFERCLVCYSYSKSLSLPGERIGWVLVPPTVPEHDELLAAVAGAGRKLGFVCAPALFQRAVAACIDVPAKLDVYARNRALLCAILDKAGIRYVAPQGAFYVWARALEDDAVAFAEHAKAHELLIVPSNSFGTSSWFRVGYCTDEQTINASEEAWLALAHEYER